MNIQFKKIERGIFGNTDFDCFQKCPVCYLLQSYPIESPGVERICSKMWR